MSLVGLYVHYQNRQGRKYITGLSPLCSEMEESEVLIEVE